MEKEEKLPTQQLLDETKPYNIEVNAEIITTKSGKPIKIDLPDKPKGRGITYTLKAFGENIKRLDEAGLLNEADKKALAIVRQNVLIKYTGL